MLPLLQPTFFAVLTARQSLKSGGCGLGVNVDVSNQTFWVGQKFEQLARNFLGCMDRKWENSECMDCASTGAFSFVH